MSNKPTKQLLYDNTNPTEFYPKNLMGNILDGEDGENLYSYLSKFNHINVGYVASIEAARQAVPDLFRYKGIHITFYTNELSTTQMYMGTNNDSNEWLKDENWTNVDGAVIVEDNSITLEKLNEEVLRIIQGTANLTVVNHADEEDLTEVEAGRDENNLLYSVLKLADKAYSPADFSGYGRVYLRKNIVDGKNILTTDMVNQGNTFYILQYDYDLNGEVIELQDTTFIVAIGGSVTNGKIIGNYIDILKLRNEGDKLPSYIAPPYVLQIYNDKDDNNSVSLYCNGKKLVQLYTKDEFEKGIDKEYDIDNFTDVLYCYKECLYNISRVPLIIGQCMQIPNYDTQAKFAVGMFNMKEQSIEFTNSLNPDYLISFKMNDDKIHIRYIDGGVDN